MQCKLSRPLLQHMISISSCSMFPALAPPSPADFSPAPWGGGGSPPRHAPPQQVPENPLFQLQDVVSTTSLPPFFANFLRFKVCQRSNSFFSAITLFHIFVFFYSQMEINWKVKVGAFNVFWLLGYVEENSLVPVHPSQSQHDGKAWQRWTNGDKCLLNVGV